MTNTQSKTGVYAGIWVGLIVFTILSYWASTHPSSSIISLIALLFISASIKFLLISFGFMELFWAHWFWRVLALLYAVILFSAMAIIMI